MERDSFKIIEINRCKKFVSLKRCNECGDRMSDNQGREQLAVFHPAITTIVQRISEKVMSFPDTIHPHIRHKFPSMDCRNLCAAKVLANSLIENLTRNEADGFILIQELWGGITSVSDANWVNREQKYCNLCDLRFYQTSHTFNHLISCHPECLALVQFLRSRPLSKLNIPKDVIVLRQTFVKLEKLSSHLYQKCITNGYVTLKENAGAQSLFVAQPNSRLKKINAEVMKRAKKITKNPSHPDTNSITVTNGSKKTFKKSQENFNLRKCNSLQSGHLKNSTLPTTGKIIRYGVEDLMRDRLKKNLEKDRIAEKEKILKKMLAKHHEKEIKKEILYSQKMLTRYVMKHRRFLFKLEENLINARKCITSKLYSEQLLEKVNFYVTNDKVKKTVEYLLKKLFNAMEKVPTIKKSSELHLSSEDQRFGESPVQGISKCVPPEAKKDIVLSRKRVKRFLVEKDSKEENFDAPFLQDVRNNSAYKAGNKVSVQKSRKKMSFNLDLSSEDDIDEPPLQCTMKHVTSANISTSKVRHQTTCGISSFPAYENSASFSSTSVCKLDPKITDPFVNTTLITEDKQILECFCGKLNCVGLHLENFY